MSLLETIRNKPHNQKVRLVWILTLAAVGVLIFVWVITSQIGKRSQKDLSLFKTIGRGLNDFKNNFRK